MYSRPQSWFRSRSSAAAAAKVAAEQLTAGAAQQEGHVVQLQQTLQREFLVSSISSSPAPAHHAASARQSSSSSSRLKISIELAKYSCALIFGLSCHVEETSWLMDKHHVGKSHQVILFEEPTRSKYGRSILWSCNLYNLDPIQITSSFRTEKITLDGTPLVNWPPCRITDWMFCIHTHADTQTQNIISVAAKDCTMSDLLSEPP